MIIGEAASHIPDPIAARHPAVSWSQLRAMRNVIAHHDFRIDVDLVWQTATNSAEEPGEQIRSVIETERFGEE